MFAFFGLGRQEFEQLADCATCAILPLILVFVVLLFRQGQRKPPRG